jgi:predicted CopG family antitoxin
MSKTIKIDPETYQQLDQLRRKGETFSQAVSRLLDIYNHVQKMYRAMAREKGGM